MVLTVIALSDRFRAADPSGYNTPVRIEAQQLRILHGLSHTPFGNTNCRSSCVDYKSNLHQSRRLILLKLVRSL